jgi:hypothetical protein
MLFVETFFIVISVFEYGFRWYPLIRLCIRVAYSHVDLGYHPTILQTPGLYIRFEPFAVVFTGLSKPYFCFNRIFGASRRCRSYMFELFDHHIMSPNDDTAIFTYESMLECVRLTSPVSPLTRTVSRHIHWFLAVSYCYYISELIWS